jgi:DNA-binding CsgD family transcriptional regulator/PAS domain-containing protein
MSRLSPDVLSTIIGDIYDCSFNPAGWPQVLTRVTHALDAAYSTISLANPLSSSGYMARMAAHSGWDPEQLRILNEEYGVAGIPGLAAVLTNDVDHPWSTLTQMPEAEFQESAFYRNWAKPQGLRDACITKVVHTPDRVGVLGTITRENRDIISAEEQHFVALLSPHIRRSAMIGDLLDHARVAGDLYRTALDGLGTPIILTDKDSRILYGNARAQAMLSAELPVRSRLGVLQARHPMATRALADAIAHTSCGDQALGSRGIGIPVSAPDEPPSVLYVLPLTHGTARESLRPATAAIFISTAGSAAPPADATLLALFDLTPAEARVMTRIGSGQTNAAAMADLGISENTLKTHLTRVYAKTGVSRQAGLMKLMTEIAAPYVAGEPNLGP